MEPIQKNCFVFKVNESKFKESNITNTVNQIQRVLKRYSKEISPDCKNVNIELGRINDDIITGKIRLRITLSILIDELKRRGFEVTIKR